MTLAHRRPPRRGTGAKQRNGRHAQTGGKMQRAGVAGNENAGARQHGQKQRQFRHRRQNHRVRREFFQFGHQRLFAFAERSGEDDRTSGLRRPDDRKFAQCASGHCFFGWLEATWQTTARSSGRIFFAASASDGSAWISASSEAGGGICQPDKSCASRADSCCAFRLRRNPVGVAKFPAQKSAAFVPAQPPARADETGSKSRRGHCWRNPPSGQNVRGAARESSARFGWAAHGRAGAASARPG